MKLKFGNLPEVNSISEWGTGSVVRLFVHFLAFLDDISYPIAALGRCFDCSSTICFPYAILDLKLVPSPQKSMFEKPEVWDECRT